jgi:hypothetical protein
MTRSLPIRRVRFRWPDDAEVRWTPRTPEFATAANAVSMQMPHVEPFIVSTVRRATDEIVASSPSAADDHAEVLAVARDYAAQEAGHHAQHRRFNDHLVAAYPGLGKVDRLTARWVGFLRRRSTRFGLAFATGFETIAFISARWVDEHTTLLRDADPTAATLFLWHLAEEVEHKEVAWDLYQTHGGGRLRLALGTAAAAFTLAWFALVATWTMLWADRRLFSPTAHLRLLGWSLSFIFAALPAMVISLLPGHHPGDLVDPTGLEHWLDHLDVESATVPTWALP